MPCDTHATYFQQGGQVPAGRPESQSIPSLEAQSTFQILPTTGGYGPHLLSDLHIFLSRNSASPTLGVVDNTKGLLMTL